MLVSIVSFLLFIEGLLFLVVYLFGTFGAKPRVFGATFIGFGFGFQIFFTGAFRTGFDRLQIIFLLLFDLDGYVEKIIELFRRHSHIGHRFNFLAHRLCSVCYGGFMIDSKSSYSGAPARQVYRAVRYRIYLVRFCPEIILFKCDST